LRRFARIVVAKAFVQSLWIASVMGEKSEEPKAAPSHETFVKKLLYGAGGVVLVPLIGSLIGAYFQQRSWSNENRNARIAADMQNAVTIGSNVATLTNERFSALLQLADLADRQGVGKEGWDSANQRLAASNKAWEVSFTNFMSQLRFYVDSPFGIDLENAMQKAAGEDCTKLQHGQTLDMTSFPSAVYLFAALNNCYAHVASARSGLGHVWHVNAILSCQIDSRVLSIRRTLDQVSFFKALIGLNGSNLYQLPERETDCLAEYKR
jgi:hypothetical protein